MQIIPAILPKKFEEIKEKMAQVNGLIDVVQIDLCDGRFVHTITWPFWQGNERQFEKLANEEIAMPFWDTLDIEWDLMMKEPQDIIDNLIRIGAKRIIIHASSVPDPIVILEKLDSYTRENIEWGIAILPHKENVDTYKDAIEQYDFVQVMGMDTIGVQGSHLLETTYETISAVRTLFPNKEISVDGGVSLQNAQNLFDAGATRLVSGTGVFSSGDISQTIRTFNKIK
ncbi:MAG: hypothetical protein WCO58_01240 [bacterium]